MSEKSFSQFFAALLRALDEFRNNRDVLEVRDLFLTAFVFRFLSLPHQPIQLPSKVGIHALLADGMEDMCRRFNEALVEIEKCKPSLHGIFDISYTSTKSDLQESLDKQLYWLLLELNQLPEDLEAFQNAYTQLIAYFAESSKKAAPDFYSPPTVANLIADLLDPKPGMSIYDPVCGSGGFLLAAGAHINQSTANKKFVHLFGQDMNASTWRIAKQNMLVHGFLDADIKLGNILETPQNIDRNGKLLAFDIAVANPPFSVRYRIHGDRDIDYQRFTYGLPPQQNADYGFIQHILASLKQGGRAAIIVPDGVLFRGATEHKIRQAIVEDRNVEAIIALPPNLFQGTPIPTNILVLRKKIADDEILFIDARKQFESKGKRTNSIEESTLEKIVKTFKTKANVEGFSRSVSLKEVSENEFNLNVTRYIVSVSVEQSVPTSTLIEKQIAFELKLKNLQAEMNKLINISQETTLN